MGEKKYLTVDPFKCAWHEELRFKEAGRGCVSFEASAHNDVTLVFREQVGTPHYHYKMDNSPNYIVVLGSHRNRRLKIEVNGKTVVDVAGVGLCSSSAFQSYWIVVYDGLISVGKGKLPFQDLVFQWLDSMPNRNVQYVGLSSWDKHVGYRNVIVLPLAQYYGSLQYHIGFNKDEAKNAENWDRDDGTDGFEEWALASFLESWDLADVTFVLDDGKRIPAHRIILDASGKFDFSSSKKDVISIALTMYPVLHAFLEYIYTGRTKIVESQIEYLHALSGRFQVLSLMKECEGIISRLKTNKKLQDSKKKIEISYVDSHALGQGIFPRALPMNHQKLQSLFALASHSDVSIFIGDHGLVARAHKIILTSWSAPFAKMFTNGMVESNSSEIVLRDVNVDTFHAMLEFMYSGELGGKGTEEMHNLLIPLLFLADQFGVALLYRECCKCLMDRLTEDLVCSVLILISSIPSCKLLVEACQSNFSKHFDYCTTSTVEFELLEEETFKNILEHPNLTVTSEEKVLDAILVWCTQANEVCSWETIDELLESSTPELLFNKRLLALMNFLPCVRFPLMPRTRLEKLMETRLYSKIPTFKELIVEAITYLNCGTISAEGDQNTRFQHRRSSFKELRYLCDGDSNGVMYFAGTLYGEHQWVNPVSSKKIVVTASSPASRYTDPKALVSRTYQATSFAGPRLENGRNCAWWMIDIGQDHQLMCNYYTLRQDGSTAYMRSWALQGSSDGERWTNLRVHENDQTICKPGQFSSWPVDSPTALLPFRYFRILLTAPTTGVPNQWNLCICFLEMYGYFR